MWVPDITDKKFRGCQVPLESVLTQALTSVIVALSKQILFVLQWYHRRRLLKDLISARNETRKKIWEIDWHASKSMTSFESKTHLFFCYCCSENLILHCCIDITDRKRVFKNLILARNLTRKKVNWHASKSLTIFESEAHRFSVIVALKTLSSFELQWYHHRRLFKDQIPVRN